MRTTLIKTIASFCMLVIILQACKKKENCTAENYKNFYFKNNIILNANRYDTIRIGDTIEFKLRIPFTQYNIRDNREAFIGNTNLKNHGLWLTIVNNIAGNLSIDGLTGFKLIKNVGDYYEQTSAAIRYTLVKQGEYYVYSLKIVPIIGGLARINASNIFGDLKNDCFEYQIVNSWSNYNNNHQFYYSLTGCNAAQSSLTDSDLFIWVK